MKTNIVDRIDLIHSIPYGFDKSQKVIDEVLKDFGFELSVIISQDKRPKPPAMKYQFILGSLTAR